MKLFGFDTDSVWDYENGFYLTSHGTRLCKLLAQFELYKSIVHLPGHVVECGVYKGASLIRFATFREALESPYSRKIIAFDAFGRFPAHVDARDGAFVRDFEKAGGDGISVAELKRVFDHKSFNNYELIQGDILETVPRYVDDHPELKVALLHVDVSVYQPTKVVLEHLYEKVVKGGLVLLDDFGTVKGETSAIDEFLAERDLTVEKLPISHIPAYLRK
jgi:hypothetical protein